MKNIPYRELKNNFWQQIGLLIFQERVKRGLKLKQLGTQIGCTPKELENIEMGRSHFNWKIFKIISFFEKEFEITLK